MRTRDDDFIKLFEEYSGSIDKNNQQINELSLTVQKLIHDDMEHHLGNNQPLLQQMIRDQIQYFKTLLEGLQLTLKIAGQSQLRKDIQDALDTLYLDAVTYYALNIGAYENEPSSSLNLEETYQEIKQKIDELSRAISNLKENMSLDLTENNSIPSTDDRPLSPPPGFKIFDRALSKKPGWQPDINLVKNIENENDENEKSHTLKKT